jgi:hypothetical protein
MAFAYSKDIQREKLVSLKRRGLVPWHHVAKDLEKKKTCFVLMQDPSSRLGKRIISGVKRGNLELRV